MPQPVQTAFPTAILNDGREMPQFGFGTYGIDNDQAEDKVAEAIKRGYRLVDTASIYDNEEGVGKGVGSRHDVFLTTKIWNDRHGHAEAKAAFREALARMGRDEVDLLLIHWPAPGKDLFVDTWKALIELREDGRVKSIGVANFMPEHLDRLIKETGVTPAVNQIQVHPMWQQREVRAYNRDKGIITQSWSPLGAGQLLRHPVLVEIAEELDVPVASVILRWHLQHGLAPIPKTENPERMSDNLDAMRVVLNRDHMARIDALDHPEGRLGPDPMVHGNDA
ncbi:aldo/keto reductase [Croceicoccus gelatinilyticus]|uniref:aldo/keto reductase n=1 Tax=Croceicoccus gelatinilyticus TaxID=2835536 RepID=UPI001BCF876D|nr:aldo/keto reductase [Croceicoccus gelatinilyticus]MBS7669093.1 aldo/keto reductase [Croceicoccus gelatinilyticus]